MAELSRQEIISTLQRLQGSVAETQASIFEEVAEFKTEQRRVSVREKFRRIVLWMDRYVEPLSAIVDVNGLLEAAFAETGRLLRLAGERALFRELGAAQRTLRVIRRVERFALRTFHQCRREIHPLYESLRRASFIAEGAALTLARLRRDGVRGWPESFGFGVVTLRFQYAPSDMAIARTLRRLVETPPVKPPGLRLPSAGNEPPAKRCRQWLDALPARITPELPVNDLVGWIVVHHPEKNVSDVLAGFTKLLYHRSFRGEFSGTERIRYITADGALRGYPVRLEAKEARQCFPNVWNSRNEHTLSRKRIRLREARQKKRRVAMASSPTKLVLINAGCYDYAEVELVGALQIVGPNNTGKTTLINTLQLLYIDNWRQMDFGSFRLEQTHGYYFRDQYSYVLFECLSGSDYSVVGWRGQSPASGAMPERFFYSGRYRMEDFYDEVSDVREPRAISARLAQRSYRPVPESAQWQKLLLPTTAAENSGLGLVALQDRETYPQFRETLKNLLTLSTIMQAQMRDRLLMLAELSPDLVALDAQSLFGREYQQLKDQRTELDKFQQRAAEVRELLRQWSDRQIASAIEAERVQMQERKEASGEKQRMLSGKCRQATEQFDAVMGQYRECQPAIFNVPVIRTTDIAEDFHPAVAQYFRLQQRENEATRKVDDGLRRMEMAFGTRYVGSDEADTMRRLREELDALVDHQTALS